jgi:hypothetical protein
MINLDNEWIGFCICIIKKRNWICKSSQIARWIFRKFIKCNNKVDDGYFMPKYFVNLVVLKLFSLV